MASRPGGSGQTAGRGAQWSPSQEDSHRGWEPWAGLHFYSLRRLLFEINIEKRASPTPQHETWLSAARQLTEAELGAQGSKCWAQAGSLRPTEAEARGAQVPRWGHGEEGVWAALLLLARGGPIFSRWGN